MQKSSSKPWECRTCWALSVPLELRAEQNPRGKRGGGGLPALSTLRGCRGDGAAGTSLQRQQEGWRLDTGKLSAGRTEALRCQQRSQSVSSWRLPRRWGTSLWRGSAATPTLAGQGPGTSGTLEESAEAGAGSAQGRLGRRAQWGEGRVFPHWVGLTLPAGGAWPVGLPWLSPLRSGS